MEADEALQKLGKYSKWQMKNYFMYAAGFGLPFAWMTMSIVFIGDTPGHRCAMPENATLNDTIPYTINKHGNLEYSSCKMFVNSSIDNSTTSCTDGYWYDPASGYQKTIVSEWDLVCGTGWLVELSMTINQVGAAVGAIIFSRLSDVYGRKPIFIACIWSNVLIAFIQAFSPSYLFYTVLSFLDGLQQQGMISTACVLAVELFPTAQRTFALNAIEFFWAFGYMTIVPFAYLIRHWRWLQVAITIPLFFSVSFYWLVSESIPWLIANGKKEKAEELLREALRFNGKPLPDEPLLHVPLDIYLGEREHSEEDYKTRWEKFKGCVTHKTKTSPSQETEEGEIAHKYGVADLFKSRVVLKYTLAAFVLWFTNGLAYYAINFTVTYLPGDRYINTLLYALLEVPAYAVAWYLMYRVGRRVPLCAFHLIAGVALICTIIQNFDLYTPRLQPLIVTFSMIGKFGITMSFATVYVLTPEIFPTNVRTIGLGLCQLCSKIAMNIAPFSRTLTRSHPWLPPVIIGALSVAAGFTALLLPETRHTALPQTIVEVEGWEKNTRV